MTELRWGERTYVMGIINVTPDSFSGDGLAPAGRVVDEVVGAALEQARGFVAAGADILDVGAESSRPAHFHGEHPAGIGQQEAAVAVPTVEAAGARVRRPCVDQHRHHQGRGGAPGAGRRRDHRQRRVGRAERPDHHDRRRRRGAHLVLMHNKEAAEYPDGVFDEVVAWLTDAINDASGLRRAAPST